MEKKIYLGDGVYASVENGMIQLETNRETRDDNATDVIYLDKAMLGFLVDFVERVLP